MANEWNSLFNSDDDDSEFEGFNPSDIDETKTRSIGSDISISEVDHSLAIVYNNAHVYLYIFIHTFWKFA
jgi:hypothetical protein